VKAKPLTVARIAPVLSAVVAALCLGACATRIPAAPPEPPVAPPESAPRKASGFDRLPRANREFRGLWVATVGNLDWPSARGLDPDRQKAEALSILDRAAALNLNAILFQVRPAGDAFYAGAREPWSIFLTGTMGEDPGYDPLAFWIEEAHERGLQLHAWFNPFRVGYPSIKAEDYSGQSVVRSKPELVRRIGSKGHYWLDPGRRESADHVLGVLADILAYDVDGLVMDDYFYPYASYYDAGAANDPARDFPDEETFSAAVAAGYSGRRDEWRRGAVDSFVKAVYDLAKSRKPSVLVGISPFGIWRPTYPDGIAGMDSFAENYADSRSWLNEGWLDYLSPQLYWPIKQSAQSFPVLLGWWSRENEKGRHIWPSINLAMNSPANLPSPEIRAHEFASQIHVERGMQGGSPGFALFRASALLEPSEGRPSPAYQGAQVVSDIERALAAPALVPETPWIPGAAPARPLPSHALDGNALKLSWAPVEGAFRYVSYVHRRSSRTVASISGEERIWWEQDIMNGSTPSKSYEMIREGKGSGDAIDMAIVTAVDRAGRESGMTVLAIPSGP